MEERERARADEVLGVALDIGESLLKNGGEIGRVEDTVTRICRAYGARRVSVFAITAMIDVSVEMPDGAVATQLRRIYTSANDYDKFERFNAISREVCAGGITLAQARQKIAEAETSQPYPGWVVVLGSALAAGAFAVFFGGSLLDGAAAAAVGAIISVLGRLLSARVNQAAHTLLVSFLAGVLVLLFARLGFGDDPDKVMIGTIMLLIPGIAFGNSVRDVIGGDHISGSIRMVQSLLLAVSVAIGYWLAISVFGGLL